MKYVIPKIRSSPSITTYEVIAIVTFSTHDTQNTMSIQRRMSLTLFATGNTHHCVVVVLKVQRKHFFKIASEFLRDLDEMLPPYDIYTL